MSRIAVTGAAGPVGRRVCALVAADADVTDVLALDRAAPPASVRPGSVRAASAPSATDHRLAPVRDARVHLRDGDLDALFAGVDVVCHLAGSDPLEGTAVDHDLHTTARVLAAVERCGVGHVIIRTTAAVYGAWADNPVPLTEADELRPNDESPWIVVRAGIEDRIRAFADANPDVVVTVLRPCVTVSEEGPDELGRVLAAARVVAPGDDDAPVQFVHADDVAAAVDCLRRRRAAGTFNVAPDGWLSASQTRALVGGTPQMKLPDRAARRVTAFGWRFRLAPTPPGFLPFVTHPWVVANDRLREQGWVPDFSNDEAFVAAHDAAPWAQISPKQRQELALGVTVVALVGSIAGVGLWLRRRLRRRS